MKNKTLMSVLLAFAGGLVANLLMMVETILAGNYITLFWFCLLEAIFPVFVILYKNQSALQTFLRAGMTFVFFEVIILAKSFSGFNGWFLPLVCEFVDEDNMGLGLLLIAHVIIFLSTLLITAFVKALVCLIKKSKED